MLGLQGLGSRSDLYDHLDFRNFNKPTRWHPEYTMTGSHPQTPANLPRPHSGVNLSVSSFLSPIPEDYQTAHRYHSDLDLTSRTLGGRRVGGFTRFDNIYLGEIPHVKRSHSENAHDRKFAKRPRRKGQNSKKRQRNDKPKISGGAEGYSGTDYSPSMSSEGYSSSPSIKDTLAGVGNRDSLDSITDSESSGERRSYSGKNVDRGKTTSIVRSGYSREKAPKRSSSYSNRLRENLSSSGSPLSNRSNWKLTEADFSRNSSQTRVQRPVSYSDLPAASPSQSEQLPGRPSQAFMNRSPMSPSINIQRPSQTDPELYHSNWLALSKSSPNLLTLPNGGSSKGEGSRSRSDRESSGSNRHSIISERSRNSVGGPRPQSIFDLGASAISAEMVTHRPSEAAKVAFSSLELPHGLMPASSKKLRRLCSPVIMVLLLLVLAVSLGAAVYFAVVLNKTQTEHAEYLRATLKFYLNETSSEKLTSLTTSERTLFEKKYCNEINNLYEKSSLSDTYRGCEVATLQNGRLSMVLYFDNSSSNQSSSAHPDSDVILEILASSAAPIGQEQSDVISIHNVPLKMSTVDVSLEQTWKVPKFATVTHSGETSYPSNTTDGKQTTPHKPTTVPTTTSEPFPVCKKGESGAYHRFPGSCSVFFQCLDGTAITMGCKHGLVFDLDQKMCVPEVTGCDAVAEDDTSFLDVDPVDLQPCKTKGGDYHPHPRACNLYFQCSIEGLSHLQACPNGLVFSTRSNTCIRLRDRSQCPQS